MKKNVVIDRVSYGQDLMSCLHPKPENHKEIAGRVYVRAHELETFDYLGFQISLEDFSGLKNRDILAPGAVVCINALSVEGMSQEEKENYLPYQPDYKLIGVNPTNYHDLNVQITDFPVVLSGDDPITEKYIVEGKLVGGPEAGKEIEIRVSKDSFHEFVMPVRNCNSFNRIRSLTTEDMRVFLEKGDALTFKSCMPVEEDVYESMGWIQPMMFDAEATMLATKMFHKDTRFEKGHCQLSVMFNTSHLIGRVCDVQFEASEKPNFSSYTKLKITGAQKMGVGNPPCVVVRSLSLM